MTHRIAGRTFGLLTAESIAGKDLWNCNLWKCRCACGRFTRTTATKLIRGERTSCGCSINMRNEKGRWER